MELVGRFMTAAHCSRHAVTKSAETREHAPIDPIAGAIEAIIGR
jgi:hypothetical protein